MTDSKKEIQKQLKAGRKFGTKPVILDELNTVVPGSNAKNQHLKTMSQNYVEKPKSE